MPRGTLRLLVARLPVDPDRADLLARARLSVRETALLVSLGGGAGALLRAVLESAVRSGPGWPWATLLINLSGSAALAVLLVLLEELFRRSRVVRPLVGTGVLGGYTTFSTFAVEAVARLDAHRVALGLVYIAASVGGALAAALLGVSLGRAACRLVGGRRRTGAEFSGRYGDGL